MESPEWNDKTEDEKITDLLMQQISTLHKIRNEAAQAIKQSQVTQIKTIDKKINARRKHLKQPPFEVGDVVELYDNSIKTSFSGKLVDKWLGPFYVHKNYGNSTYHLKTKEGKLLRRAVHGNRLKIYNVPEIFFRPTFSASLPKQNEFL